jgi:hypothetical protein
MWSPIWKFIYGGPIFNLLRQVGVRLSWRQKPQTANRWLTFILQLCTMTFCNSQSVSLSLCH